MRTCGHCFWFRLDKGSSANNAESEVLGSCGGMPPTGYPTQMKHKLTGETTIGAMPIRPPVFSNEPACSLFEDKDTDPFEIPDEIPGELPTNYGGTD
jgi:hypothetical protein